MKLNADTVIVGSGVAGLFQRVEFTKRTGYYINYQVRSGKQ